MTIEEKIFLNRERQKAVREAWKNEKRLVLEGKGTRNWSKQQQKEILKRGSVKGYDGHHMKSVIKYPQYAGNPKNIQFLTEKEHYNAHGGNYKMPTNGYYNAETNEMIKFRGNELKSVPINKLNANIISKVDNDDKSNKQNNKLTEKNKCQTFRDSINSYQSKGNVIQKNNHSNKNTR